MIKKENNTVMFLGGIIGVIVSFQFSLTVAFRATTSFTISASYHQLSLPQKIRPIANIHFAPTQRLFMNNNNNKDNDIIEYNDFDDEEIVGLGSQPKTSTRQYSEEFDEKLWEKLQERIDEQTIQKKNESIFSNNEKTKSTQQYTSNNITQENKDKLFWGQSSVEFLALGVSLFFIVVVALLGDNLFSKMSSSTPLSSSRVVNADKILQEDFDKYGSSIYFESNDKSINNSDE